MESRPLRHTLKIAVQSLESVLRWPIDHLVPSYSGILGSNETVLQVCVTLNFIIAIGLLLARYKIKGDKSQYKSITVGIQANCSLVSVLNVLTRFPKRSDILSTPRSYLLLNSTFFQLVVLLHGISQGQELDSFYAIIHFGFIFDTFLLRGFWQTLANCNTPTFLFIVYTLIPWMIAGFILPAHESKDEDESKQTDLSIAKLDVRTRQITREILVASIDTIVLLLLQYA